MEEKLELIENYLKKLRLEYDSAGLFIRPGHDNPFYGYIQISDGIDTSYQLETGGETVAGVINEIADQIKTGY